MVEDGVWVIGADTMIEILASMQAFGIAVDLRDLCLSLWSPSPVPTRRYRLEGTAHPFARSKRRIGQHLHRLYLLQRTGTCRRADQMHCA